MKKTLKSDDSKGSSAGGSASSAPGSGANSSVNAQNKLLGGKKDKKAKQAQVSDIGVIDQVGTDEKKDHTDSFEKYYNKDLDLDEDQVPVVIYELNESAINFISQESFEKALILLQKAQTMLEQIQASKNPNDQFVFLLTMHNMALCYQKLGALDECSVCLEQCLKHLQSEFIQDFFNDNAQPSLKLKMLKYKCKTHMQICALLSQIHKHREAAVHANDAVKISHFLIHDAESMCSFYTKELIQKKPLEEVSIISNFMYSLLEKTAVKLLPVFQHVLKKVALEDDCKEQDGGVPVTGPLPKEHHSLRGRSSAILSPSNTIKVAQEKANSRLGSGMSLNVGDADMKNILGYLNQNEWIYSLNIGNIMQIAPLTLQDFMSSTALQIELSREFVLEKLCFLAVSYFCMGTEFRFLHQLNEKISGVSFQRKDSEYWHGKAVELAISFLPSESPLVSHILMSYEKHHSPSNMAIPEEEVQDVKVRVVRQITGVDSNRLQPIIRFHPDSDYRVQYITTHPLDYYAINGRSQTTSSALGSSMGARRRNLDNKKAASTVGKSSAGTPNMPARPHGKKPPSQPLTSKTNHTRQMVFNNNGKNVSDQDHTGVHHDETLSSGGDESDHKLSDNEADNETTNLESVVVEDMRHKKIRKHNIMSPQDSEQRDHTFMKLEDQKAHTAKKNKKQGQQLVQQNGTDKRQDFNTLNQHIKNQLKGDNLHVEDEDEDVRSPPLGAGSVNRHGIPDQGAQVTQQYRNQAFLEIEIQNAANRQRSSDIGIAIKGNQNNRMIQHPDGKLSNGDPNIANGGKPVKYDHMTTLELTKLAEQNQQVLSDPEQQNEQPFSQERRARSSLSNRNPSNVAKKQATKSPAVGSAIAANTSQLMANAQEVITNNLIGGGGNHNLNSSQPIQGLNNSMQVSSNKHNQIDLNNSLRHGSKNRSLINESINNGNGNGQFDSTNGATGDRIQSRAQPKRSSSQNGTAAPNQASTSASNAQQFQQQPNSQFYQPQKSSSSRRFKSNSQANQDNQDHQLVEIQREIAKQRQTGPSGPSNITEKISQKSQRQNLLNQKGAAPITDIRAKRQASTLNVDDMPGSGSNPNSQALVASILNHQQNQIQGIPNNGAGTAGNQPQVTQIPRNNKKFIEMASKANSSMLANQQHQQQLLMNQFQSKGQGSKIMHAEIIKEQFERDIIVPTTVNQRVSQNVIGQGRSSKNQLAQNQLPQAPGGQSSSNTPLVATAKPLSSTKRSKGSKSKSYQSTGANSVQGGANQNSTQNSALTNDQLMFLMQAKRDKFNNSALVSGTRQLDDLGGGGMYVAGGNGPSGGQSQQVGIGGGNHTNQHLVNLNKLYSNKRTPTSMTGASHEQIIQAQQNAVKSGHGHTSKSSKHKDMGFNKNQTAILQQHLQEANTGVTMQGRSSSKGQDGAHQYNTASGGGGSSSQTSGKVTHHPRGGSQLSVPSNQMMFFDSAHLQNQGSQVQVQQYNRKGSMENKLGGSAAVGGVVNPPELMQQQRGSTENSSGNTGIVQPGQIRSKAQYDNWLQLQVMKKGGGNGSRGGSQPVTTTGSGAQYIGAQSSNPSSSTKHRRS